MIEMHPCTTCPFFQNKHHSNANPPKIEGLCRAESQYKYLYEDGIAFGCGDHPKVVIQVALLKGVAFREGFVEDADTFTVEQLAGRLMALGVL